MHHFKAELPPRARSVSLARRQLTNLIALASPRPDWADSASLALSEVVTNAIVHTSTPVVIEAWASDVGLRVEVVDSSQHLPRPRHYAVTSGTGRGLHILDQCTDRWGAALLAVGKVVWFEVGEPAGPVTDPTPGHPTSLAPPTVSPDTRLVDITLLNTPLLVAWAWQEHAQALLREYLLFGLDDDPAVLDHHAEASDALSVLHEQIPVPILPEDPDELLANTLEPEVSSVSLQLSITPAAIPHFTTLATTLRRASAAAQDGLFLGPPTQPEVSELRDWICDEVTRQAVGQAAPRPWAPRTGIHEPLADASTLRAEYREALVTGESILATDDASIIVAVSPTVVSFLGYDTESDLLGRRVIAVVPQRYHQAHIAGTTLNATNGRDRLLDVAINVPVVRADGSEAHVELRVVARRLDNDHRVFVAHFGI